MSNEQSRFIMQQTLYGLSRAHYVRSLGFTAYDWQTAILESKHKRKSINAARQSGKSTIVASVPCHTAKYYPNSLSIIIAPTEAQATEDILKVKDFIALDQYYPDIVRDSMGEVALENKSRIIVIPATERSARGYSQPRVVVVEEASRVPDVVYKSGILPMLTGNEECEVFQISTPFGKQGFFYESHQMSKYWERYEVRSPFQVDPNDNYNLIDYLPEAQYVEQLAMRGIKAWYSPRHFNKSEQFEFLESMGAQQYRQEFCCEFVEQEDAVFSYDEIAFAMGAACEPLDGYGTRVPAPTEVGNIFDFSYDVFDPIARNGLHEQVYKLRKEQGVMDE